jgi:integrase/recombinase XerD
LVAECPKRSVSGARDLASALRSFLRFLHVARLIDAPLVWAVPSVADLRDRTLPRGLEPAAVRKMLASCDRRRTVGRRDYAILLLLSRLGLRRGEVAAIGLEDVDWRAGELRSAARAPGRTCCLCRWTLVKRWCHICAAARGARAGRCSCG